ncbi:WD40-repeat-containing domain protein [Kockiozyma suomiensis]|uniref:WD40-repeat-containing domain protein n=1 Tax=Kockiozyma suomiensis TaxID=1337062 RepID=UPI0033431275
MRLSIPTFGLFDSEEPPVKHKALPGAFDVSDDESVFSATRPESIAHLTTSITAASTDPLSRHILRRTGTELNVSSAADLSRTASFAPGDDRAMTSRPASTISRRLSRQETAKQLQLLQPQQQQQLMHPQQKPSSLLTVASARASQKHGGKHVTFFSRFGKSSNSSQRPASSDSQSASGDSDVDSGSIRRSVRRAEGNDATLFSSSAAEYMLHSLEPPRYIRVRAHGKMYKDFDRLFLAQELHRRPNSDGESAVVSVNVSTSSLILPPNKRGAIWVLKFSKNGKYLAAGGEDRIVRIWSVISSPAERARSEQQQQEDDDDAPVADNASLHRSRRHHRRSQRLQAPLFQPFPIHEFAGHQSDVLDLSWSKNDFLLSSSMDKTVRLWHVSRQECLCCFQHEDFVTSIAFHPSDDRFFLSGSLDSVLRLWSIPDKTVVYRAELPDLITAVAFTTDGQTAIAGCFTGLCFFYETVGLRYHTRMHVRSSHGKNSKGSKITGIVHLEKSPESVSSDAKLLITSNDSRIRLYNMRDKSLEAKLKGNENVCSQIRATASEDGRYVICGSEDERVYIWDMRQKFKKASKHAYEYFTAHNHVVTEAVFAPSATIELLSQSCDPIYDMCTPPPVRLIPPGEDGPIANAPSRHSDGNIIVSADQYGSIKVFRQDCAYTKRKEAAEAVAVLSKTSSHSTPSHSIRRNDSNLYTPSPLTHNNTPSRLSARSEERHSSLTSRASRSLSRIGRSKKRNLPLVTGPSRQASNASPAANNLSAERPRLSVSHLEPGSFSLPVSSSSENEEEADNLSQHLSAVPTNSLSYFSDGLSDYESDIASSHRGESELSCPKCHGRNFKASITARKETKLVCSNCGSLVV